MTTNNERIVITGLGAVTPLGLNVPDFWKNLIDGKSGIKKITSFDTTPFDRKLGGEIQDFNSDDMMNSSIKKMGRGSQLAIISTKEALQDSELSIENTDPFRIGVCLGTTNGEAQEFEQMDRDWLAGGIATINNEQPQKYPCYQISRNIARTFGLCGPNMMLPNACSAGNFAAGYGFDMIRSGRADVMIVGGSDAFSMVAHAGFCRLGSVAKETPKPFSKNRDGMMVAEGAGVFVLESMSYAKKRGAKILAELLGYGISCDAHHMTQPHPEAHGLIQAYKQALKTTRLNPRDIEYICAHGTGTPLNDRAESTAIKSIFPNHYKALPVSSLKSAMGHSMGAASAIESVACIKAINESIVPPTTFYEEKDPECDLCIVSRVGMKKNIQIVANSASAFGGNNAILIISKFANN